MPFYLFQWQYKDPAIKAMVETPQDRPAELRKVVEAFHGRVHQFFFAFRRIRWHQHRRVPQQ